jgi:small nuclear ribonucleoprotein (snRNP)-like protein
MADKFAPPGMQENRGVGVHLLPVAVLVAGFAIATALFLLAFGGPAAFVPSGPIGSLQTVTLTNGNVYFGHLKAVDHGSVVLSDVFEGVSSTDPKTQQRTTQLVSRRSSSWHGPLDMAIPVDKILFTETVGSGSPVAKAIEAASAK